ncbi:hypothetical protein ACAG26_07760 [Mycobacterium sp. pUA109]|uniref:hypothetical protein n=1 Tax=Mycobacterium sp. pUA109 TaxID=3238982 RepID=UPI00351AF8CF
MDAAAAIASVTEHVRGAGMNYPTTGLVADRFETGWSVYAPVELDTNDPMSFLDMPVGRAVFLIGDSGRIEQVSSSIPPQVARQRFADQERMLARQTASTDSGEVLAQFADAFGAAGSGRRPAARGFSIVDDAAPADESAAARDEQIGAHASAMLDPIAQELAMLGPPGWREFTAVFALTVRAGSAACEFLTANGPQPVTVPEPIVARAREQRRVSAGMSAGPWWRLIMTVTSRGRLRVTYDYGDQPFPDDQLQPADNYRADVAAYPRPALPVWLAGYLAGPTAQARPPAQAAAAVAADHAAGRQPVDTDDIEPLPDTWTRWAVLAAVAVGARSQWGPRITLGMAWYESDARSGATLYVLPGDRAVLSGGQWNSPLLAAAYQNHQPLPDLYCGAPEWVNDTVLNTRNQNGLLTFCYWWADGRWWRGATDTFDELDDPLPTIWTPQETVTAMAAVAGPGVEDACQRLLLAAAQRAATHELLAAVFAAYRDPDLDTALNQLSLAGLTR